MRCDFFVLGATGIQGKIVSRDLLEKGYSVLLGGRDKSRVEHLLNKHKKTGFKYIELRDKKNMAKAIKEAKADVVINCAEGDWNFEVLNACTDANSHLIDLGSDIETTKKQLALDKELKKKNLIHITGCGSIPGICNVLLKHVSEKFDRISTIDVGFDWSANIKKFVVPFSIQSIIEEFINPATIFKHGKFVKIKPLESATFCYTRAVGKQKCFNESHHPECYTFQHYFENMGLKDVKTYAGFPKYSFDRIMDMIELGFGSSKDLEYNGVKTSPIEFLTETLKRLPIPEGYKETENLWAHVKGKKDGKEKYIKIECVVPTLKGWEEAGCNVDTGLPASITAQMIKKGVISTPGSYAPEAIIPTEEFFKEIGKRNMIIYENGKQIN